MDYSIESFGLTSESPDEYAQDIATWENCVLGKGETEAEAYLDALETLEVEWDGVAELGLPPSWGDDTTEKCIFCRQDESMCESCDTWFWVGIYFN